MEREEKKVQIQNAARSLLAMQRHSWEQGTAMQAFLEMGDMETVCAMAREAVYRRMPDGRAATIGVTDGVTDPCSVGEALIAACQFTHDPMLEEGLEALLTWTLQKAPRNEEGILYHLTTSKQFWVDSMYMLPPFLAAAGEYDQACRQMKAYYEALYDKEAGLMCHMWDDENRTYVRAAHWGSGNGWALAGMTRLHGLLSSDGYEEEKAWLRERITGLLNKVLSWKREDGLFHDVIDDSSAFVETNLSQMTAYTIYRGMAEGWLSASYEKEGELLRKAAEGKMDKFGFIHDVCGAPTFDKPGFSPEGQAFYLLMEHAYSRYGNLYQIRVCDKEGKSKAVSEKGVKAELKAQMPYCEGDFIEIEASKAPCPVMVSLDPSLPSAMVWMSETAMVFPIPFGEERQAYPADAFSGTPQISVRPVLKEQWNSYRNLSENPLDRRGETTYYPHCSASVETRGESVFAARNTIDGRCENTSHGEWPYTSWGDNEDPDAEILIEFGREVLADQAEILIRADFPHDNYWEKAVMEFSDGSSLLLNLVKTKEWQKISFSPRKIAWVKLKHLIRSEEESPFPALTQWRIFGRDQSI